MYDKDILRSIFFNVWKLKNLYIYISYFKILRIIFGCLFLFFIYQQRLIIASSWDFIIHAVPNFMYILILI